MTFLRAVKLCVIGAALLSMAAPVQAAPRVNTAGACAPNSVIYKTTDTTQSTSSVGAVDVHGLSASINQGSTNCVLIAFTAQAFTASNDGLFVQAVIDGNVCPPGATLLVRNAPDIGSYAMNFVCPDVAPGRHTVKMQFSSNNGGAATLINRTMFVQYVR